MSRWGKGNINRSPGNSSLLKFHHTPKVENKMKGEEHRTSFTLLMEGKEKDTRFPSYLVMNNQGTRTLTKLSNNKQQI